MNIIVLGSGLYATIAATQFALMGNKVALLSDEWGDKDSILGAYGHEPDLVKFFNLCVKEGNIRFETSSKNFEFVIIADENSEDIWLKNVDKLDGVDLRNICFILFSPTSIGESNVFRKRFSGGAAVICIPLYVREGEAMKNFSHPDYIIIGCDDDQGFVLAKTLFSPFMRKAKVINIVTTKEAEFAAFAGNAMLATRISFMNEMASLAERMNVDVNVIKECIGADPRIGGDYLEPGCGYGGNALQNDVSSVAQELQLRNDDLGLLKTVEKINERQKDLLFRKIWQYFRADIKGKTVAIWGGAFKPESVSLIGSPAICLIDSLLAHSVNIKIYDPMANENLKAHYCGSKYVKVLPKRDDVLEGADVLVICTAWKEFFSPDFGLIKQKLREEVIFDGRNLYSIEHLKALSIKYFAIGRGAVFSK